VAGTFPAAIPHIPPPPPFQPSSDPASRASGALRGAAPLIGEDSEYERCRALLTDADSSCVEVLLP